MHWGYFLLDAVSGYGDVPRPQKESVERRDLLRTP